MAEIKSLINIDNDFDIEFEKIFLPRGKIFNTSARQKDTEKFYKKNFGEFFELFRKNETLITSIKKQAAASLDKKFKKSGCDIKEGDITKILRDLFIYFDGQEKSSPVLLESIVLQIVSDLLKNIRSLVSKNVVANSAELCFTLLKVEIFLHNYGCYVQNSKLTYIDNISSIAATCFGLFEFLLVNDKENAKKVSVKYKQLLDRVPLVDKPVFVKSYYVGMIKLSVHENLDKTTYYALKLLKQKDTTKNGRIIFGGSFIMACQLLFGHNNDKNNFEQALFWIERLQDTALELLDSGEEIQIASDGLSFYKKHHPSVNQKVFSQKVEYVKTCFQETNVVVESFYDEKGIEEEYIRLLVPTGLISLLKKLRTENIICLPSKKDSSICLYNINSIHHRSLTKVTDSWKINVAMEIKRKAVSKLLSEQTPISVSPVIFSAPQKMKMEEESLEPMAASNKTKMKTKGNVSQLPPAENAPVVKTVNWGNDYPVYVKGDGRNSVYKVRGETVQNHYVYINTQLFASMSASDPIKLKGLVNLCDRGKVLNDSTGKRGLIIKGELAEAKDAGHDHRFFGEVVSTTVKKDKEGNNKTVKLIEINAYKKTHNQTKTVKYGNTQGGSLANQKCPSK